MAPEPTIDRSSQFVMSITWEDAPHLGEKERNDYLASMPAYLRAARTKGIPSLGAGAVYPIAEERLLIEDFAIPIHWPKVYGMDVGWNWTAAAWVAIDEQNDTVYLYNEYKAKQAEPAVHAAAIRARGHWIPGVVDPAARSSSPVDGKKLFSEYLDLELDLFPAENAVEAGIFAVLRRMSEGRFKVFESCRAWLAEFRMYQRDEKGHIKKVNDHLMDCTKYIELSGLQRAMVVPDDNDLYSDESLYSARSTGRSDVTGY